MTGINAGSSFPVARLLPLVLGAGTAPLVRCVARSLFVGSPRVSVNHDSRYHRRVIDSESLLVLREGNLRAGLWRGASRSAASENEQFDLLAQVCRWGLLRGFLVQRFGAVEVACDGLDAPVEVMFEQLHRALDVPVFDGQQ